MVNSVVLRDLGGGLDFLAKAKSLRPRPQNLALRSRSRSRPRPRKNITACISSQSLSSDIADLFFHPPFGVFHSRLKTHLISKSFFL